MHLDIESPPVSVVPTSRRWPAFALRAWGGERAGIEITDSSVIFAVAADATDAGSNGVELASGQHFWVGQQSLPPGAVVGAEVVKISAVADAIQILLEMAPAAVDRCVMAIPPSAAISRRVDLPTGLSEASAEAHIERATSELIAQPRVDIALDFRPLPSEASSADDQPWLLLAARVNWVEQRQAVAQALNLSLERVDWSACAQLRALHGSVAEPSVAGAAVLMVHCDQNGGMLMAIYRGWPVHVEHRPALASEALLDWLEDRTRTQPLLNTGASGGTIWLTGSGWSAKAKEAFEQRYGRRVQPVATPGGLMALGACGLAMDITP